MEAVVKENILKGKSIRFAIRIVELYNKLCTEKKEYVMSKQLLRSGTAIGALIAEAKFAQSKPDFIHKSSIALKECNESLYWLEILVTAGYITSEEYDSMNSDCTEILKILVSSIKTLKASL